MLHDRHYSGEDTEIEKKRHNHHQMIKHLNYFRQNAKSPHTEQRPSLWEIEIYK